MLTPADLLSLQRQAGNGAVVSWVASWDRSTAPPAPTTDRPPVVQRLGLGDALGVLTSWAGFVVDPSAIAELLFGDADGEMALLKVLIVGGMTDKNKLASAVFYARHPERVFTPLTKTEKAGQAEWKEIRATKVKAALAAAKKKKTKGYRAPEHEAAAPVAEIDPDAMAAALANPQVVVVSGAVEQMNAKAEAIRKPYGEERGRARDELVDEIRSVRGLIAGLSSASLPASQVDAVKAHFYRQVNAVSPFYEQDPNMNLLEGDATRTCGITSVAMCLEALGKTATDYTGPSVANVAKVYGGKVDSAKDQQGGLDGLRLPDFIQLVAIAKCGGATGDVQSAMEKAWTRIKSIHFVADIANDFGVPGQVGAMKTQHASKATELRSKAEALHKKRVALLETQAALAKLEVEGDPKKAKKRSQLAAKIEKYQTSLGSMHEGLSPDYLDKLITVESFKAQVLTNIKPELDRGRQVVNNMTRHYVRVESVTEDGMISDDPGGTQRKNRPVSWEEGRAMAFFHDYLILG